ncbi:MAG: SAM-dependent methyltransferase, partial [Thiohalomonadales bacterium]
MTVYFIGAGPGDPDLITVKAQRLLRQCPLIIYAGSLVPAAILANAGTQADLVDSAKMTLAEIIKLVLNAEKEGKDVARLHSGDPSVYGAIGEQIRQLQKHGIAYEIIPGV